MHNLLLLLVHVAPFNVDKCAVARIENPRVDGSIPPLATNRIK